MDLKVFGLVLIANVIGWPIAWYFMSDWLGGFAYRITINPRIFIVTGAAVLLIAFLCILYHLYVILCG
jgi:putative ABC transport system permease protein